jgi:quinolinate synthase
MKISQELQDIKNSLTATMMPHDIEIVMPLIEQIQELKRDKNAVILGHNYMTPDVFYGVSDYVGDSLGLSREASQVDADIILFNGVHFMAETAKILNPHKKVLIADLNAGCSLAESITAADVRQLKDRHPGAPVVSYVNCSAEVKAETDVCCTSANAVTVVESLEAETIIFIPDAYLAKNVQKQTGKHLISWDKGTCMVHELYSPEDIEAVRRFFDDLVVISHPECDTPVTEASDFSGSTSQMESFIHESGSKNIMLLTECSMADNLRSKFPGKHFVSTCQTCPHMKRITLPKVLRALTDEKYEVTVEEETASRARQAVERMLEIG